MKSDQAAKYQETNQFKSCKKKYRKHTLRNGVDSKVSIKNAISIVPVCTEATGS